MSEKGKRWVKAAIVRAIKTFAQTFASLIVVGSTISEVDWTMIGSVSFVAMVLSIATSLAGLPEVKEVE